jgi:hypothetical protein
LVLVALSPPADNDRSPRYMEKALAAIHQGIARRHPVTLSFGVVRDEVALLMQFPTASEHAVLGPILASYPQCAVEALEHEGVVLGSPGGGRVWQADLRLDPQLFPILRHGQFEDLLARRYADPIDSVLQAIRPDDRLRCRVDFEIRPASPKRCKTAKTAVRLLERTFFEKNGRLASFYARNILNDYFWFWATVLGCIASRSRKPDRTVPLDLSASRGHEREADLQAAADKIGGHLFDVRLRLVVQGPANGEDLVEQRMRAIVGALGAVTRSRLARFKVARVRRGMPRWTQPKFILSHEELATLWHLPTAGSATERLHAAAFTERQAPVRLYDGTGEGEVPLGQVQFRSDTRSVGLGRDDRRRHQYVIGKTGMGKSTLLLHQIAADIRSHRGVCLIDPHGDLAEAVLKTVPAARTNDVIIFDPGEGEHAVAFNPLDCPDERRMDQVASGAVSALRKMYDSWGPRLEDTLRNAVYAAIEEKGTLLTVLRLLSDARYRDGIVGRLREPMVRAFWQHEFATWSAAYRTEAVAAIQNKIRPFLTNRSIRAIVSQSHHSLDLRRVMDEGKVLIVNLSKGRIGEDNSAMLGALLVSSLQEAAMRRADTPEADRRDYSIVIDEFQNFTTGSFATILSEARKYGVSLTLSHQYLQQLDERTGAAVRGNIGTIVSFAVGSEDAEWLAAAMSKAAGQLAAHDLTNLPKFTACVRLLVDGVPSAPFTLRTLPPPMATDNRSDIIRQHSRRQYARQSSEVLKRIEREMAT